MRNDSLVKKVFGGWFKEEQGATDEVGSGTKEVQETGEDQSGGSRRSISLSSSLDGTLPPRPTTIGIGSTNLYDPQYEAVVMQAIEESNFPGTDYFEYSAAVSAAIQEDHKPEDVAFKDTFKILRRTDKMFGLDVLMTTSDKYIAVAQRLLDGFIAESEKEITNAQGDLDVYLRDIRKPIDAVKDKEAASRLEQCNTDAVAEWMNGVRAHQEQRQAKMRFHVERVITNIRNDQERINRHLSSIN